MDCLCYNNIFWEIGNAYFENLTVNFPNSTIKVLTWPENKFAGIMTSFP